MPPSKLALINGEVGRLLIDNFSRDDVRLLVEALAAREQDLDTLGHHDEAAHARRLLRRLRTALQAAA